MRCIVDVDGTLWDLHPLLIPMLNDQYGTSFDMHNRTWNFYEDQITDEQFYRVVDLAHLRQFERSAFEGAIELFAVLAKAKLEVIVASHRNADTLPRLVYWLDREDLVPFSGVYAGYDKKFLMAPGDLVIDDNPCTIQYAIATGCKVLSLRWPWNTETAAVLFDNLHEMVEWLEVELSGGAPSSISLD